MNDSFSSSNHINFRSAQYENLKSVLGMTTVEINPTELCNRTCSFCPRGNGYPNKDEHLTIDDAYLIKNRLDEFEYQGIIIISGKGEPLLNPDILEIVNVFKNEWI